MGHGKPDNRTQHFRFLKFSPRKTEISLILKLWKVKENRMCE